MQALNEQAQRILKLFGQTDGAFVASTAGPEQEYFLIDRHFYFARPDLLTAGRTLFGAKPPKGQEFEDHYFGAIPERVLAFMLEVERELFKLGIPVKTRHNEVAPAQYEIAPVFESANLANDHQQLIMITLKRVAEKYGMACLTHEKPFAGVNGSGKHVNWSLGSATQGNLLDPGDTPHENAQFLVFCARCDAGRVQVSGLAAGRRRHGRQRSPLRAPTKPRRRSSRSSSAISSPTCLSRSRRAARSRRSPRVRSTSASTYCRRCRRMPATATARVPFAFTGNRFEFRAVGSNQSIAGPLVAMNTIVAESLDFCATKLEKATGGDPVEAQFGAIQTLLTEIYTECESIIFNGDGYSDAWHEEAAKRGLLNLKSSVDALPQTQHARRQGLVRQVRRALRARTRQPPRHLPGAVLQDGHDRSQAHDRDGQDDDLPGRDSLPERTGLDVCEPEAGRLRVRHRHARSRSPSW